MEVLTEHFQHEESLMKKCGFGKPSEQFSSYANHVKDHERILDIGFNELGKLSRQSEALDRSFLATTVSDESGCSSGNSTT
jgi:hemerythrin